MFKNLVEKSYSLSDNVEKLCRDGQATDDNMAHAIARWILQATNMHTEYVTPIAFQGQQCLHESTTIHVILTLPVLLYICYALRSCAYVFLY
jgi:hypothetical protein